MDKAVLARDIILLAALRDAREAASKEGIELAALKGAALLELGLYQPGERGMADADVLVRARDLKRFEGLLTGLGFEPMPESADAWLRPSAGGAPPAILDIHTALWHVADTEALFDWGLEPGPEGVALNLADLFLHTAVHPLLHHGELTARAMEDCRRIAARGTEVHGRGFWPSAARKAGFYSLRPAAWPAVRRLLEAGAVAPADAEAFRPRGPEKIKAAFFEKAASRRSTLLEYLLPVLHRPGLALKYAVPGAEFMRRRYGSASPAAYLLRPLRLALGLLFRR